MADENNVIKAAEGICANDGRGVQVTGISPLADNSYAVVISLPNQGGRSDSEKWAILNDIRDKLLEIPSVSQVHLEISP